MAKPSPRQNRRSQPAKVRQSPASPRPPLSAATTQARPKSTRPPQNKIKSRPKSNIVSFPTGLTEAPLSTGSPRKPPTLWSLTLKLGIVATALTAMTGTGLSVLKPELKAQPDTTPAALAQLNAPELSPLPPEKPLTQVEKTIQQWFAAKKQLQGGAYFLNLTTGNSVNVDGTQIVAAASTIKIPVLVALFQALDRGEITLAEPLTMRPDLIAGEAGTMQYQKPGTKFSTLETAELMISISDNTATNMLIDRLGGATILNDQFVQWGLEHTVIRNPLPDMEGTNTTSPKDLAILMARIAQGDLVSQTSREKLLGIMRTTVTNTLLPQGLGPGAKIAHKTGDIGTFVGDAGLIEMPNGQQYVAGIMVKRPYNDPQGTELIRQISRLTYQAYSRGNPFHQ
ncbi:serine hydrolase [Synechococcus sp. PCC 6312]|uniref:serine hydrolase n=1 Tax=Synechococcus sp. (strain ATCC 27167 / PCC 6312) TaxID=195253 RepID=UPI00029EEFEE|nr:serine hydrolase [Synechococcus sp. PCC 6312]AFY62102.1 beta-lactamase class A [Synechococcus sp. PCC 6312]